MKEAEDKTGRCTRGQGSLITVNISLMDDEEKVVIFWIGAVRRMEGIQGGLCCEEQRLCLYHSVPARLAPLHFLAVLFGFKRALYGSRR